MDGAFGKNSSPEKWKRTVRPLFKEPKFYKCSNLFFRKVPLEFTQEKIFELQ
jgi:hypothetical protein